MSRPLAEVPSFEALPVVTNLLSRPIASFVVKDQIWEIGWNGIWVARRVGPKPSPTPR